MRLVGVRVLPPSSGVRRLRALRPHRLVAKDTTLSRWRHGFESRWGCTVGAAPLGLQRWGCHRNTWSGHCSTVCQPPPAEPRPSFVRRSGTTFAEASFPRASAKTRSRSSVACWYLSAAAGLRLALSKVTLRLVHALTQRLGDSHTVVANVAIVLRGAGTLKVAP